MTTIEHRGVNTAVRSSLLLSRVGHSPAPQGKPLPDRVTSTLVKTGSNQLRMRENNQLLVLQTIRTEGPLTRRALAVATGLTFQAVENISKRLIEAGIVQDVPPTTTDGRSRHLILRPAGAHAIGISLTATICEVALCDLRGRVVSANRLDLAGPAQALRWLPLAVADLVDAATVPVGTVLGAGVVTAAVGCERDDRSGRRGPSDSDIQHHLRLPTISKNAVLTAVCAQQWAGHLTARDAVYVHLGADIGGAIVSNGRLSTGATGRGGGIAHLTADPAGTDCRCGRRGCLDTVLRESHLATSVARAVGSPGTPSMAVIARLAQAIPAVADVLDRAARQLVHALIPAVQLLDPAQLILGGSTVVALGESFRDRVSQHLIAAGRPAPAVVCALPVAGPAASAATLVLQQVFTPSADRLLAGDG